MKVDGIVYAEDGWMCDGYHVSSGYLMRRRVASAPFKNFVLAYTNQRDLF